MRILLIILCLFPALFAQENYKLVSGEGLALTDDAETRGVGNIFATGFGRAFYWDNPTGGAKGGFPLKIFPCAGIEAGLLPYLDFGASSELLSYGFKTPGNLRLRLKATLPNNDRLRLINGAISLQYTRNLVKQFASFGYRNEVVGFYAEGLMMLGNSYEIRALGDVEFIQWKSFLPLKFYLNVGYRFSTESIAVATDHQTPSPSEYSQLLLSTGVEYKGLTTDFFVEYALEALGGFKGKQKITFVDDKRQAKVFPYYFVENPMYLSPGLRIKYANGVTLMAAAPIKLSQEKGPGLGTYRVAPYSDGYSPFYASWKIIGRMTIPIHFQVVNAEITRKFLLMKNRATKQSIDIDEEIQKKEGKETGPKDEEQEMQEDIEKRKQEILKDNLLE